MARKDHRESPQANSSGFEDWYLVRLKPGGLARAEHNLARQMIGTFCPMRWRTSRRDRRLVTEMRPMFPGYLFVNVPPGSAGWRSINATYGVAQAVCMEPGRPARLPPEIMRVLLAGGATLDGRHLTVLPGDRVRVAAGPFADALARVEALPERDRILVLLDIMGRKVRTSLGPADLERA